MALRLAPEAASQLDQIWYYTATETGSIERADRIVDLLTERFYLLSAHPRLGRQRPDLREDLRSLIVGDYVVLYRIEAGEDVAILHVMHGRQDIRERL